MSQPPPYNRLTNFTDYAIAHTSAPYNASDHDAELDAVEATVDAICTNLALIQRDDGELANETVGIDQIETELRALIAVGEDGVVEPWTAGHSYNPGDAVSESTDAYLCMVAHVAGTFALDLGAGYWVLIGVDPISLSLSAALTSFAPTGTISSTNVQAAIAEVATEAAAATAAVVASAIPLAEKGVAGGVATLDGAGTVPVAQIPDLSAIYVTPGDAAATYIPITEKAAPLGVATLDAVGIVVSSQLPPSGGPFVPLGQKGAALGVAELDAAALVPVAQLPPYVAKTAATGAAVMPTGTTGDRPGSPATGYLRWNSTLAALEAWNGTAWEVVGAAPALKATNRIINGKFAIDQRNAGAAVTVNTSGIHYGPDRWWGSTPGSGSAFTLQREADSTYPGEYRLKIAVTVADVVLSATENYYVNHIIEGIHFADLYSGSANAQQFTLAFEVESTITGTFPVAFKNSAGNRSYVGTYTVNVANTREQKSITLTADTTGTWLTDTGVGLYIQFGLLWGTTYQAAANVWSAGSFAGVAGATNFMGTVGNTMRLRNVRLYKGAVDLGVDQRLYADELELCLRYFYRMGKSGAVNVGGLGAIGGSTVLDFQFRSLVPMRTAPAMGVSSWAWSGASPVGNQVACFNLAASGFITSTHATITPSWGSLDDLVSNGLFRLTGAGGAFGGTAGQAIQLYIGSSAYIDFNAEL